MKSVHVELLLGRRVEDANGEVAGRIFEIHAVRRGAQCFVEEYALGATGLLARLGLTSARLFGWTSERKPTTIPWHLMDLSDPEHPRLTVAMAALQTAGSK